MPISRRAFVGSAAALMSPRFAHARSHTQIDGANDRISIGVIGLGGMGRANLTHFAQVPGVRIAALCDVWDLALADAAKAMATRPEGPPDTYKDFRHVLDRSDIDAVVVATPDHWHGLMTIRACQAGKDVYVEKPLSHNVVEGRKMVEAARTGARVVQLGTQQRSGAHYQEAVALIREGAIGKVSRVATWNHEYRYPVGVGRYPDGAPPAGLDWDLWLGPAPSVPFNPSRFLGSFRHFWDYAGGMVADWGVHHLDIVQWAMAVDAPIAVSAVGGKYALEDAREAPDTIEVMLEYPGFLASYSNRLASGRGYNGKSYGIEFYGTDATLFVDRSGWEILPEMTTPDPAGGLAPTPMHERMMAAGSRVLASPRQVRAPRVSPRQGPGSDQNLPHVRNFLDCMRSRQRPISDVEIGHRSTTAALLGNVAYRSGMRIQWDSGAERITNSDAANALLSRTYRAPWAL